MQPGLNKGLNGCTHGNMQDTTFVAEEQDTDVQDRKIKAGESAVTETCNLYYFKSGRAHWHLVKCKQGSSTSPVIWNRRLSTALHETAIGRD
ncbi:TPA: hypothetical protein N0F65_003445 [Lagenidium giganteum]|uniref:Uncharacterized protein n=1 Tax=Lagenidium giganteum TaxID=4803 RepID=A0AAV2YLQ1_9STRA|nr:TPA: hypothetical protein N0F65_003445 [Lagenidium giganteum]